MPRVLTIGESPLINSGFANVLRKLNDYFISLGHEIEQLGWCQTAAMPNSVYDYPIHPVNYPKGHMYGSDIFDNIVMNFKPDIVFSLGDPYMVDWIPRMQTRDDFTWIGYTPIDSKPIPSVWVKTMEDMDFPVTYSYFGKEVLDEQLTKAKNPAKMLYHGIDTDVFYPVDGNKIRKRHKIPEDTFVLLYVGVNSARKQIPRMLEAFKIFSEGKEDVMLYLHTTLAHNAGREGWWLQELLPRLGIVEKTMMAKKAGPIGGADERTMRLTYNISDVLISPSSCEGFGLPFIEAGACGIPSIAVNYSSMPELLEGRGELVPASDWTYHTPYCQKRALIDIDEFANRMEKIYQDRKLLKEYGDNAYEFAQSLSWENILPQFGELIDEALEYEHTPAIQEDKKIETVIL